MIMITDKLRVRRYDDRNFVVEEFNEESKAKRERDKWKFVGYYPTFKTALRGISKQDMLVDFETLESISEYVASVEKQTDRLIEVFMKHK